MVHYISGHTGSVLQDENEYSRKNIGLLGTK